MVGDHWVDTTLGAIADKEGYGLVDGPFGSNLPASDYVVAGIPVIRGSNLALGTCRFDDSDFVFVSPETAQRLCRSLCYSGDIVFTKKGTLGQTGLVPHHPQYQKFLLSSNQMKLTVDRELADPLFTYYYVSSPKTREKIIQDSEATGVPKTNVAYLRTFPIQLPPLPEQQAIAWILGTLDDKIELNRRMNETLEATARAIFKSWFVDFDPVRAKADGRKPTGMDAATAALFPAAFQDSPLGPIPKGWRVVPLGGAFEINPTRSLGKGQVAPYLDMGNMPTTSPRALGWIDREFTSGMKFVQGDVLVARITPCLENGKTAYVDFLPDGQAGWGSTEYIVLRSKPPLPLEYAYFLARSEEFRQHAITNMTGSSGRQRVPVSCFDRFLTVVPPEPVASCFGQITGPTMQTIKAKDDESRTLTAARDALLPKLLSGEVRVKDVEAALEARS
jgi:type I restriction enzyme, S subunit